jgi:hypothetical protein
MFRRLVTIMMCTFYAVVSPPSIVAWVRVVAIGRPPPPVGVTETEEEGKGGIGVIIGTALVVVDLGRVFVSCAFDNGSVAHV